MRILQNTVVAFAVLGSSLIGAMAQPPSMAVLPDPSKIPFVLPKDIKWKIDPDFGEEIATLVGDQSKPGPYIMLIKWAPGQFSTPHFHSTDRYVYVISGTWWVSAKDHYDPDSTYPLRAGTFATDLAGKIHWDGAKNEPVLLELVGLGPATTTKVVDEKHQ